MLKKVFLQNHKQVLDSLSPDRVDMRLIGLFLLIMLGTLSLLFFYPSDLLMQISAEFEKMGDSTVQDIFQQWLFPILLVLEIISEVFWGLLWVWISKRVLKKRHVSLSFVHMVNIFLVARLYETLMSLTILCGYIVVAFFSHTPVSFVAEDMGAISWLGILSTILFLWVYIGSIQYVASNYGKKTPLLQKK